MNRVLEKKVLITGSEGFTGRYMSAEMRAAGYRVVGLGARAGASPDYYQADLSNPNKLFQTLKMIQPDIVIHLAGIAFVEQKEVSVFYHVNLVGTYHLLEGLSHCDKRPEAVLLASSANVYGNSSEGRLTEHCAPEPANDYAVSKLAMEQMARLWMDQLPIILTRPFNYTGVGQEARFLIPKIVSHFCRRAKTIELGNLEVRRDFSDVRAVAQAYRRLIESNAFGQTVNICAGCSYSLHDVLALCEAITGHTVDVRVNPAFVRAGEVKALWGSPNRLRNLIGAWQPPPLQQTLAWMLEAE